MSRTSKPGKAPQKGETHESLLVYQLTLRVAPPKGHDANDITQLFLDALRKALPAYHGHIMVMSCKPEQKGVTHD